MKISTIHKKFAERLGKIDALENPQDYLGPNTSTVLNFWLYLDKLDKEQLRIVGERYNAASVAASVAARDAAGYAADYAADYAARDAAGYAAWYAASNAAGYAAWYAAGTSGRSGSARYAAAYATYELIGSHLILEQGKSLFFVPMFDRL